MLGCVDRPSLRLLRACKCLLSRVLHAPTRLAVGGVLLYGPTLTDVLPSESNRIDSIDERAASIQSRVNRSRASIAIRQSSRRG